MNGLVRYDRKFNVYQVCKVLRYSRQAYYKSCKYRDKRQFEYGLVLEEVRRIRRTLPRVGTLKLHHLLERYLAHNQIKIGRDKLNKLLKDNDLLIERPSRRYISTTQSLHPFKVYKNLFNNEQSDRPDQVWVSDITYIRTRQGFCFLALITDTYSRKIVGYDISDSLELEGCYRALKQAIGKTGNYNQKLIHHSDRGSQYCSHKYTALLKEKGIQISMADRGNCYQNAMAERINGILKQEFMLGVNFVTKKQAIKTTRQAIQIYNQDRPHRAIKLNTPNNLYAA